MEARSFSSLSILVELLVSPFLDKCYPSLKAND